MRIKEIFEIMYEVIPIELSDYFEIDAEHDYSEKTIQNFIEDIITDIKDNLN